MKEELVRIGITLPAQGYPLGMIKEEEWKSGEESGHFELTVQSAEGAIDPEVLAWRVGELQSEGAWNFFWFSHFGMRRMNHWFGLLLCQGSYEEAVRTFLFDTGKEESPEIRLIRQTARQVFDDPVAMTRVFGELSDVFKYELTLVSHLADHPKDYAGALNVISEEVQRWVEAYGCFLYNRVLSWCVEQGECGDSLPWAMSDDEKQRGYYAELFEIDEVPEDFWSNLKSFPVLALDARTVTTKFFPKAISFEIVPEGAKVVFDLEKNTDPLVLLAHLFEVKIIPELMKKPRE